MARLYILYNLWLYSNSFRQLYNGRKLMRFCSKSDWSFYFACWLVIFGRRQKAVITCTEEYSNCIPCVCVHIFVEGGRTTVGEDKTNQ